MTAEALVNVLLAKFLVRFVRLGRWRGSLGRNLNSQTVLGEAIDQAESKDARRLARSVMRASQRVPGHTKCLPQAMALQWMLKRRGIPSVLVTAVYKGSPTEGVDRYHAWVEHGGALIIGHCDKAMYQPLMQLAQGAIDQGPADAG